jgi:serine/threonine protein phosphatase 1
METAPAAVTPTAPDLSARFARLTGNLRVWAVSSIHGDLHRLEGIHDAIQRRLRPRDALVYLGNMVGRGPAVRETIAELLTFRRDFIARRGAFVTDLVYLRGSQEEMWQRLLELQFAPDPPAVLRWMLDHGMAAVIDAYGADLDHGMAACRDGPLAITRWTNTIRAAINSSPGHSSLLTSVRRAAFTAGGELLFVHAGIDPSRPLTAQNDSFWWGGSGFLDLAAPYAGFHAVVRGYDKHHGGLQVTPYAISIDRGCGFGGTLACACFELDGTIVDSFEA